MLNKGGNLQQWIWILVVIVLIAIVIGIYLLVSGGKTVKEGGNVTSNESEKITELGGEEIVVEGNVTERIGNLSNESEGIQN